MRNAVVRLKSIQINDFKNVKNGFLSFENPRKNYRASMVGLYGQNGSGKTALIDAIDLLRLALSGRPIPVKFGECINVNADSAKLKYEFTVINTDNSAIYDVFYEFVIKKVIDDSSQNIDLPKTADNLFKTIIYDEKLSFSYKCGDKTVRLSPVINAIDGDIFVPKTKYNILVGRQEKNKQELIITKRLALITSRSFIFSKELLNVIRENCKDDLYKFLIEALVNYGNFELFIINTSNDGLISMNALPLSVKYEKNGKGAAGMITVPLNRPIVVPADAIDVLDKVALSMNIVLPKIVPGLKINFDKLGFEVLENGEAGLRIQLVSYKNGKEIPLRLESEGIKKIISVLDLLIAMYNNESITIAIDELDSGIFEYLLGELLRIISENAKGQLIFTSHNLRPLETLDRGFIAFTSTNPENRYIRLVNIKTNNNLRDFYYRDIILGEQNEPVYELTNNAEIALAFKKAGEI